MGILAEGAVADWISIANDAGAWTFVVIMAWYIKTTRKDNIEEIKAIQQKSIDDLKQERSEREKAELRFHDALEASRQDMRDLTNRISISLMRCLVPGDEEE